YTVSLGDDGKSLRAMGSGLDGLVLAGFGAGHVPASMVPALAELAARIPVLLASRTGGGAIFADTYGSPGSERDLLARGLIGAGLLDPYKARILLTLLLRTGADRELITATIAAFG
ncbi:MAG: asparaginase, partial [Sciscionella sp.]|nr:asparaginase [Sciscionella sp.]